MKIPKLINVPKAAKKRSNIDLSSTHMTTMDFGRTNLSFAMECLPKDVIDMDINTFVQLAPIVLPTMGEATLYSRAFFVPFRFVWDSWESFASGHQLTPDGTVLGHVPYLRSDTIWDFLFGGISYDGTTFTDANGYWSKATSAQSQNNTFDFYINPSAPSGTSQPVALIASPEVCDYMQILRGLGYSIDPSQSVSCLQTWSALPLLSLCKVFRDYYVNPNYNYSTIDNYFNSTWASKTLSSLEVRTIMNFIRYCWYEQDLFTSAWAHPENVGLDNIYDQKTVPNSVSVSNNTVNNGVVGSYGSDSHTYLNAGTINSIARISQYGLNLLKSVRNMVMRQNAAGGRYVDQLLSKWGVSLDPKEARRAQFLGSSQARLNISRVDATAAGTDGSNTTALGDFAGRGIMSGNGHVHFEANDDRGMLLVISHIVPKTHYYQGILPHVAHVNFLDFFEPDLEGCGNVPIPTNVVYRDYKGYGSQETGAAYNNAIFGYSAYGYEYKVPFDRLTGDFTLPSRNTELQSFHMFRKLDSPYSGTQASPSGNAALLNSNFMKMNDDNIDSYTKIFNDMTNWSSHFIVDFNFKINANRPCNSLMSTLLQELNEHGNDVGEAIKMRPNGQYF